MNAPVSETRRPGANDIDPITANVIQGALNNIAVEMGHKLVRMSVSSIIRESEDFGAAVLDEQGRQIAETPQSTPLQSGPIPGYVRGMLRELEARGEELKPGDVIMHNDAYAGASHGPDVGFIVPVFQDSKLVGFAATTAHHLDIGALTPGSAGIVDAVDAYAEGLQFKAIKAYEEGRRNEQVWHMLRGNIRLPEFVIGDMEAQVASAKIGAERYLNLIEHWGLDLVQAAGEQLFETSEKRLRAQIAALPDGEYSAENMIDGLGDDPDPSRRDLPIKVTVKIKGDEMTVDLTGTARQCDDRPINMPFEGTTDCAIWFAARSVLLDSWEHGEIIQNSGLVEPIKIVAPKGSLANPIFPAPVIARFGAGIVLSNTVVQALAQAVPEQVCAGCSSLTGIIYTGGGGDSDRPFWVFFDLVAGACGGRFGKEGMDACDALFANTRNNPIEDMESHVPLRVNRFELRENETAAGKWRGGIGAIREVEFLDDGGGSCEGENHKHAPKGLFDGADGQPSELIYCPAEGEEQILPSKFPYRRFAKGDILIHKRGGGGAYGNGFDRDPERVRSDVLDEFINAEIAKEQYGVVLNDDMSIDVEETEQLRAERLNTAAQ